MEAGLFSYNYKIESGIGKVMMDYDASDEKLQDDFKKSYNKKKQMYDEPEVESEECLDIDTQIEEFWNIADRMCDEQFDDEKVIRIYKDISKERKANSRRIWKKIYKFLLYAFLYGILFVVVTMILDSFENFTNSIINIGDSNGWIQSIIDIIVFGIISTLVNNRTNIPDITESMRSVGRTYKDIRLINRYLRQKRVR